MKILKKIIKILLITILAIILCFNLFNFISIKILGNEMTTINGYAALEVISGSMEPNISIGDIIIIDTKINNYKENDIITFRDLNGSFVTHRIIEINNENVITKGDANNTVDKSITKNQIIGLYVYKIHGLGALIKSIRSTLSLIMILIIGIILCLLFSTDSKGNVILTEDEKEYMEFLELKNNRTKKDNKTTKNKK